MDFATYVRKPFTVEAVEVTEDNIDEIAEMICSIQHKENGTPFIQVDRRLVSNLFRVFPGFWVTKMDDGNNIRCYSKKSFHSQFIANSSDIEPWLSYLGETAPPEEDEVNVPMFNEVNE
jgi:hypothetical protein